jgi:hypothetical protein
MTDETSLPEGSVGVSRSVAGASAASEAPGRPGGPRNPAPIAIVFPSRSGGIGHVVIALDFDPKIVMCTCPAMRSLERRPGGCWAAAEARRMMGLPEVTI